MIKLTFNIKVGDTTIPYKATTTDIDAIETIIKASRLQHGYINIKDIKIDGKAYKG